MLAEVAGRIGRYGDAEKLLSRALELAPGFGAARANLAPVYYKQNRYAEEVETLDAVLGADQEHTAHAHIKAVEPDRLGGASEAIAPFEELRRRIHELANTRVRE